MTTPGRGEWLDSDRPYDPNEPLLIRWADAIAARNAAVALMLILQDKQIVLDEGLEWAVRNWLPTAVGVGTRDDATALVDREAALQWVRDLRDRLNTVLPGPPNRDHL